MAEQETDTGLLRAVFDAYPAPTYLVDRDAQVQLMNRAAVELAGAGELPPLQRSGEAIRCLGAHPLGCGQGGSCSRCVIRSTVDEALARGAVHRVRAFMQRRDRDGVSEVYYLVSAAPLAFGGRTLAVLTLEDVTAIARLKSLLPMCAGCRKIRNDDDYWQSLESYLKDQLDVDVSHGFCEQCVERLYPDVAATLRGER